jgi:hypothetical protein
MPIISVNELRSDVASMLTVLRFLPQRLPCRFAREAALHLVTASD